MKTEAEPTQMSLKWFEIWRIAIFHPTIKTFSRIISDPKANIKWGIIWMAITSFIAWFVGPQRAILSGWVADNFGPQAVFNFLLIGAIVAPIFGVIFLLIEAAISHGLARLFDGSGTYHQLVYCWAVMLLPYILLPVLIMYLPSIFASSRSFYFSTAGRTIQIISLLLLFGLNLYLFYAQVVAFSAVEKIGIGKSFGIFILQAIVVVITVTLLRSGFQVLMMNLARLL